MYRVGRHLQTNYPIWSPEGELIAKCMNEKDADLIVQALNDTRTKKGCKIVYKVLLNQFDEFDGEPIYVGKDDIVFANMAAREWGFTLGNKYTILEANPCGLIKLRNDDGIVDEYSVDYFCNYQPILLTDETNMGPATI